MVILGVERKTALQVKVALLVLADGRQPTTITVDEACIAEGTCFPPVAGFASDENEGSNFVCAAVNSTITLTAVDSERVRGKVSGSTGFCTGGATEQQSDFTMTNGRFDIAVVSIEDVDDLPDAVVQSLGSAESLGKMRLR